MQFTRSGKFSRTSTTTNTTTGQVLSTSGVYGSSVIYTASGGDTTLTGSDANEAFIYDLTLSGTNALRFSGFTSFDAGAGDDIIDFTVRTANAGSEYATDAAVYGGLGNDVIWTAGSHLKTVYGDTTIIAGTSASDMVQAGNDTIDLSAASVGTAVLGDGSLRWAKGGNDTITGSTSNDTLSGDGNVGGLANTKGTGGNDIIYGGAGRDTIFGEGQFMGGQTGSTCIGGDDVIYAYNATTAGTETDNIYGESQDFGAGASVTVIGGNDTIYGSNGDNALFGDGNSDGGGASANVTAGNDTIYGRDGTDTILGDGRNAAFGNGSTVTGGADTLYGDDGGDTLYGDFSLVGNGNNSTGGHAFGGADLLYGGAGDDTLIGDATTVNQGGTLTCGNDILDGGTGDDKLYGDVSGTINASTTATRGDDTFVFAPGSGADTIYDFDQSTGSLDHHDLIDVSAYGYSSGSQLDIIGNGTASVVIDFGGGNSVTVQNKAGTALVLDSPDFLFST
ncbi:calcium-binding protein [Ancylobacter lacus]|uniref:calcium-binding protein n=1 Tax=Ancylobacter lacus TaxID=2579970 RepID=UPI001BCF9031|nr:calcium-binding protein [Ancylobacter lacus]MBS7540583.1 calcium-binding protein [Ancylobacter lacus]